MRGANYRFEKSIAQKGWFSPRRFLGVFFCCFLLLVGSVEGACEQQKKSNPDTVLTIGLIPEQNIFKQMERYSPLAEYLARKTGMKIELKVLTRYGNIIDNFVSSGLDGAFFGSFTYALANSRIGVEALARPEALNGSSTYHGLIFVRKESGIKNVADMKGKRFAFVDKATTAGFLLPLWYFKTHGIGNYKTYFKEAYFTGTHEDAIYDVFHKKADIGAAKNTVYERLLAFDPQMRRALTILTKSPDVPENALAFRKTITPAVRKVMQETLLTMQNDPAAKTILTNFGARRFIPTTTKDYDPVFQYAREIGLDLARYDYVNE